MKKSYIKPQMLVVKISTCQMIATSQTLNMSSAEEYNSGSHGELGSRCGGSFWDEDEE